MKEAYIKLARYYHPNKWNSSKNLTYEENSEKFKELANEFGDLNTLNVLRLREKQIYDL